MVLSIKWTGYQNKCFIIAVSKTPESNVTCQFSMSSQCDYWTFTDLVSFDWSLADTNSATGFH